MVVSYLRRLGHGVAMIVVWLLCLCSLGYVRPVASSHFMGGTFRWRPVNPEAYDGNVRTIVTVVRTHSILEARY